MNNKIIHIAPIGGLGNQLFILCAGLSLSKEYNMKLSINPLSTFYFHQKRHYLKLLNYYNKSYDFGFKQLFSFKEFETLQESSFNYSKILLPGAANIALSGYFQSYKYFENISIELKKSFALLKNSLPIYFDSNSKNYNQALHLRLGDYEKRANQLIYGKFQLDYWIRCIETNIAEGASKQIHIFSNNIAKAKTFFEPICRTYNFYFHNPSQRDPWVDLINMSSFRYIAISNSTYSWWSAYFSEAKVITYPEPWYVNSWQTPVGLTPNSWIAIHR